VDITNKKLLLYLNAAAGTDLVQVTDTTASQLITMKCIAYGYR
jgi:fibrillarin-like rRNA methylase